MHEKCLMVAGAGFEPRSMHKQNCFQLPQAGMALPDHDYIFVRFDVANTSGAVNDARHLLQHLASEIYLAGWNLSYLSRQSFKDFAIFRIRVK